MYLIEKLLDLRRIKAGLSEVEVAVLNVLQQFSQKALVPCAGDLVERNVQRLFSDLVDVHHRTGYLGVSERHRYGQSLMPADDGHVGVDYQRIGKAEFLDAVFDLFVFLVAGLQLFARVICRRLQLRDRDHTKFCCLHLIPPHSTTAAALRLVLSSALSAQPSRGATVHSGA